MECSACVYYFIELEWSILGFGGRSFITFIIFTTFYDPLLTDADEELNKGTHVDVRVLGIDIILYVSIHLSL
jgi:hypothetical protein